MDIMRSQTPINEYLASCHRGQSHLRNLSVSQSSLFTHDCSIFGALCVNQVNQASPRTGDGWKYESNA